MSTALVIATARRLGAALLNPAETKTHQWRMNVRSASSANLYVVAQRKSNGLWECSCMGWIRHHGSASGGQYLCSHLKPMVPLLEAALTPRAVRDR